jgi:protein-tyrosine phosphatase
MNFRSVLVVCVGNICRSPVAERALAADLAARGSGVVVRSAGLGALVGHAADATASAVAARHGVTVSGHIAQQFTRDLAQAHDLVLVMEPGHRQEIARLAPDLSGRVMLFDHWCGGKGIADPYRRSPEFHEAVFLQIRDGARLWAEKLTYKAQG